MYLGCVWTMTPVEDFLRAPSEDQLACFSQEQLLHIVDHFEFETGKRGVEESL